MEMSQFVNPHMPMATASFVPSATTQAETNWNKRKRHTPNAHTMAEEIPRHAAAYTHSGHVLPIPPHPPQEPSNVTMTDDDTDMSMGSANSTSSWQSGAASSRSASASASLTSTPRSSGLTGATVDSPLQRIFKRVCMSTPIMMAQTLASRNNIYQQQPLTTIGSSPLYDGTPPSHGGDLSIRTTGLTSEALAAHSARDHLPMPDSSYSSHRPRSHSSAATYDDASSMNTSSNALTSSGERRTFVKATRRTPGAQSQFSPSTSSFAPHAHQHTQQSTDMIMVSPDAPLSTLQGASSTSASSTDSPVSTFPSSSSAHGHVSLGNSPATSQPSSAQRSPNQQHTLFFPGAVFAQPTAATAGARPTNSVGQGHRKPVIVSPTERLREKGMNASHHGMDGSDMTDSSPSPANAPFGLNSSSHLPPNSNSSSSTSTKQKRHHITGTPQGMEPRSLAGFRENQENKHKRLKEDSNHLAAAQTTIQQGFEPLPQQLPTTAASSLTFQYPAHQNQFQNRHATNHLQHHQQPSQHQGLAFTQMQSHAPFGSVISSVDTTSSSSPSSSNDSAPPSVMHHATSENHPHRHMDHSTVPTNSPALHSRSSRASNSAYIPLHSREKSTSSSGPSSGGSSSGSSARRPKGWSAALESLEKSLHSVHVSDDVAMGSSGSTLGSSESLRFLSQPNSNNTSDGSSSGLHHHHSTLDAEVSSVFSAARGRAGSIDDQLILGSTPGSRARSPLPPRAASALSSTRGSRTNHRRLLGGVPRTIVDPPGSLLSGDTPLLNRAHNRSRPSAPFKSDDDGRSSRQGMIGSPHSRSHAFGPNMDEGTDLLSSRMSCREFTDASADPDPDDSDNDLINRPRRDPNQMSLDPSTTNGYITDDTTPPDSGEEDEGDVVTNLSPHQVALSPALLVALSAPALLPPSPLLSSPLSGELPQTGLFTAVLKQARAARSQGSSSVTSPNPVTSAISTPMLGAQYDGHGTSAPTSNSQYFSWPSHL